MDLFYAILADDLQQVMILLADTRARPYDPYVLARVCERRQMKILRVLLNDIRVFPPQTDAEPIFLAAVYAADLELVALLMDSDKFKVPAKALEWVTNSGNDQMLRLLSRDKIPR